ncbi:polyprotein [Banana streak UM virus]|uniref:RNA-directed DNA polymerase n=2 Tax=Banana streak UM virus TaxID=1016857 RepID=F5AY27_9VIRU|nr:polyprotein [Banana streak UM virus]AEC49884.1 polyprotein [Banana streak UM virus]
MALRGRRLGTGSTTVLEDGTVLSDQIRNYRNGQRALYEAQNIVARPNAIFKRIFGGSETEKTLEMVMDVEAELEKSMKRRARAFPAEVVYSPRRDNKLHKVFQGRASQDLMVVDDNQMDMTFIKEETFEQLERAGLRYIHIGALQVRIQPLHQRWSGKMAFLAFQDTRSQPATIIAAMEVDLSKGAQMIYITPDFMTTIGDFYQGIQLSIKTKGYNNWRGEANLHLERMVTARLSSTSNTGFEIKIDKVIQYMKTNGIQAIEATKQSVKKYQGQDWNIRPAKVEVAMKPTAMEVKNEYDNSMTFSFHKYQATSSTPAPQYNSEDEIQLEEEVRMAICSDDESEEPSTSAIQEIEEFLAALSPREEGSESVSTARCKNKLEEEEEIINDFLKISEESVRMAEEEETDYPAIKRLEELLQQEQVKMSEVSSSSALIPADVDMEGNLPGYAPAQTKAGYSDYNPGETRFGGYSRKWSNPINNWSLPVANAATGSMLVLSIGKNSEIFERWESTTLNYMASQNIIGAEEKISRIENLLGETEKKIFIGWRTQYTTEFEILKTQAIGTNGTQNVISQIRRILLGDSPKQGTTLTQDAAYKRIKSLVCDKFTYPDIMRYMVGYLHLAARTGRMWISKELSDEFFLKLPSEIGDQARKAFDAKFPGTHIHVPARIDFTYNYLEEVCTENNRQRKLAKLDFCRGFPVINPLQRKYRSLGTRRTRTYKGKPHSSHARIDKRKYLQGRKKECRCYVCGEEGHFAKECKSKKKIQERVNIVNELDIPEGYDIVSVGYDEKSLSDIFSISEGEDNQAHLRDEEGLPEVPTTWDQWDEYYKKEFIYMADTKEVLSEEENENGPWLVGQPGGFEKQMYVTKKQYHCEGHEWFHNQPKVRSCQRCFGKFTKGQYVICGKCKVRVCHLCIQYCYGFSITKEEIPKEEENWKELASTLMIENRKLKLEKKLLLKELNDQIEANKKIKEEFPVIEETNSDAAIEIEMLQELLNEANKSNNQLRKRIAELEGASTSIILTAQEQYNETVLVTQRKDCMYRFDVFVEVEGKKEKLKALLDTGATKSCISERYIPKEFLTDSKFTVNIAGVNSMTRVTKQLKEAKLWIKETFFSLPITYVGNLDLGTNTQMIIGCNFIQSLKGAVRLEGRSVTFYKLVSTIEADEYIRRAEEQICIAHDPASFVQETFMKKNMKIINDMKELGFIGEEPLKHWANNKIKCHIRIRNPELTIQDKPHKFVTPQMKEQMQFHMNELLKRKVIRPSTSRHRTNAFIVNSGTTVDPITRKETKGKPRLVFNYKRLNDNTEKDQYSLPGINSLLNSVGNAKIYSKFDLKSGFHQVAMEEESIEWTAFWAFTGLYEWLVMPFGLKNAPAIFQRKMDNCFRGTEAFIAVYIDDILIFSKDPEEHAKHLEEMLRICKANGLILSPTKYKIGVKVVDFLGSTIGENQLHLQPHIVQKIIDFDEEKLKTKKGLKSWLAILNYARGHIKNMGRILGPLYPKTSEKGERRLNSEDWKIIRGMKQEVKNLPKLAIPPENAYIVIETDGSMNGWGGVCLWKKSKNDPKSTEQICRYASGKFAKPKSTIEAEISGVLCSLEKFRLYYLDKAEITVRTDSGAIERFYNKSTEHKPSEVRWLKFMDFISGAGPEIKFEHIKGKDNTLADLLSRLNAALKAEPTQELITLAKALKEIEYDEDNPVFKKIKEYSEKIKWPEYKKLEVVCMAQTADEVSPLLCNCEQPAGRQMSKTSRNPGRWFWSCVQRKCHAWWWDDHLEDYIETQVELRLAKIFKEQGTQEYEESMEKLVIKDNSPLPYQENPEDAYQADFIQEDYQPEDVLDLDDFTNDDQWRRS